MRPRVLSMIQARCIHHKLYVPTHGHIFWLLQASSFFPSSQNSNSEAEDKTKHLHHGRTISLSFPPCLSQTKTDLKPPPIGASRGHTSLANRRGSSLLQRYVAQNPQPNTSLKKYRWCMHHSTPALCSNIPPNWLHCCFLPRGFGY